MGRLDQVWRQPHLLPVADDVLFHQLKGQEGQDGPIELRYRAHVAFTTANQLMQNLEKLHNRRKAVIWVSSGYDFNPFEKSRLKEQLGPCDSGTDASGSSDSSSTSNCVSANGRVDPNLQPQGSQFADAELVRDMADVTRAANRANATLYTIDPRGLVAGGDIGENVDPVEWETYVSKTVDSLRTIADLTGGFAVVNQNDFDKALKRIDAETSDYYVLGFYSSNPDPLRRPTLPQCARSRPRGPRFPVAAPISSVTRRISDRS